MPELPEVTTTVKGIAATSLGQKIIDVWTDWPRSIKSPTLSKFKGNVIGAKILGAHRCGKNVLIDLSSGQTLLVHMKMTGHFLYGDYVLARNTLAAALPGPLRDDPYNRHVHFALKLSSGKYLALADVRKFAKIRLTPSKELKTCDDLKDLGPDALRVSPRDFVRRLHTKRGGKIKTVLMDQTILAGVGNIYSDEALWRAGVHPESVPSKIPEHILRKLLRDIQYVLRRGIHFSGDSDSDYRTIDGTPGNYQGKHMVYRKTGKICPKKDRGIIERRVIGGRSAHFCPKHQTLFS